MYFSVNNVKYISQIISLLEKSVCCKCYRNNVFLHGFKSAFASSKEYLQDFFLIAFLLRYLYYPYLLLYSSLHVLLLSQKKCVSSVIP